MTKLSNQLENRIKILKKFINNYKESNIINNGFYTNNWVYIKDDALLEIPQENRVLDKKKEYKKLLNKVELEEQLEVFREQKYLIKTLSNSELKNLYKDLKRFGFEQIKIRNGYFILYDEFGHKKWQCKGYTEWFKDISLDFNYKLLLNIINYFAEVATVETKIYSSKKFLVIKSGRTILYAKGVRIESDESNSE